MPRRSLQEWIAEEDGYATRQHDQVDVFLIEPETGVYLGRLCNYATCPKGKDDCLTPGCGRAPLLKQHEAFEFYADALNEDRIVRLYEHPVAPP